MMIRNIRSRCFHFRLVRQIEQFLYHIKRSSEQFEVYAVANDTHTSIGAAGCCELLGCILLHQGTLIPYK